MGGLPTAGILLHTARINAFKIVQVTMYWCVFYLQFLVDMSTICKCFLLVNFIFSHFYI